MSQYTGRLNGEKEITHTHKYTQHAHTHLSLLLVQDPKRLVKHPKIPYFPFVGKLYRITLYMALKLQKVSYLQNLYTHLQNPQKIVYISQVATPKY